MPTPPVIRETTPADELPLAELHRRTWSVLHAVLPRPRPPYAPFFDPEHPPSDYLVADLDGRGPAGYIRVAPPTPLPSNQHVRQIQGLAVDDWARRRGVARALLEAACEHSRRQGATRITLRVLGHNAPARELYAAVGFAVEGVLRGEFMLEGEYVDDVLMGRPLTPS